MRFRPLLSVSYLALRAAVPFALVLPATAQTPKAPTSFVTRINPSTAAVEMQDGSGQWVAIGTVSPASHAFMPAGLPSEISRATAAEQANAAAAAAKVTAAQAAAAAPVQTVAGRQGAVTLSNSDISGLGTSATLPVGPGGVASYSLAPTGGVTAKPLPDWLTQAPVLLPVSGPTAIPLGTANAFLTGCGSSCRVGLPLSPPDGYVQRLTVFDGTAQSATAAAGSAVVQVAPAAGQMISDGFTASTSPLSLSGSPSYALTWSATTATWTLGTDAAVAPTFSADLVNSAYSYNGVSVASPFTFANAGPATVIDSTGLIRDAATTGPRISYDVGSPPPFLGALVEGSSRNLVTASNLITPWIPDTDGWPVASTDFPALYQGTSNSAVVLKGLPESTNDWLGHLQASTSAAGTFTASSYLLIPQGYGVLHPTAVTICPTVTDNLRALALAFTAGSGGANGTFSLIFSGGDAAGTFTVSAGAIVAVNLTNTGHYSTAPTVSVANSSGATGTVTATLGAIDYTQVGQKCADMNIRGRWQRISVTTAFTGSGVKDFIIRQTNATAALSTDAVYYTAPQFEAGGKPTSYIPNAAGQANTRPADSVTTAATSTINMMNGGTLLVDMVDSAPSFVAGMSGQVALSDSTGGSNIAAIRSVGDPVSPVIDAVTQVNGTQQARLIGDTPTGLGFRAAMALNDHDLALSDSLGAGVASNPALAPNLVLPTISAAGSVAVRQMAYLPARASKGALTSIVNTSGPWPVSVDPTTPGLTIPLNFVGSSFEKSYINGASAINTRAGLKAIYQVLGGKCDMRFGGITGDTSNSALSTRLTSMVDFVAALGCPTMRYDAAFTAVAGYTTFTLSLDQIAAEVATVSAQAKVDGVGLTVGIGNEPINYNGMPFSTYLQQWQSIRSKILASVPDAVFQATDETNLSTTWNSQFAASASGGQVNTYSAHNYTTGSGFQQRQDVDLMWRENKTESLARALPQIAASGNPSALVRMSEGGSMGGQPPNCVSLTLSGALWDVWEMMVLAKNGWSGVNYHGGDSGCYSPVVANGDGTYSAQATLYGMVFFNNVVGGQIIPVTAKLPGHIAALGVLGTDGKTRLMLVNRSQTQQAVVNASSVGTWSSATVLLMTAPSALSKDLTIGGSKITSTGTLSPTLIPVAKSASGVAPIVIPPGSAALVTLQ